MIETALVDAERKGGANKYTAYTYVTDTEKRCSRCKEIKTHSEFHKDKKNIHGRGLAYYCKKCANSKSREHTKRHAHELEYKHKKKGAYIKNRFQISLQEYQERLKAQDYKCAICKINLPESGYFTHLDHCHGSGKIRKFLCTNCNRGLGHFQDNMEFLMEAIKYLQAHTENGTQKEGRCL